MNEQSRPGRGGIAVIVGGLTLVLCCAGPVLVAGGALSAIGAAVCNPVVIALGALVVLAAVVVTGMRVRARRACHRPQQDIPSEHD
jgi:mercuric ion transport protein